MGVAAGGMLAFEAKSEGIRCEKFRVLRSCAECMYEEERVPLGNWPSFFFITTELLEYLPRDENLDR